MKKSPHKPKAPLNLEKDGYLLIDNFLPVTACRQLLKEITDHTRESPPPLIKRTMRDRSLVYRVLDGVRIRQRLPARQRILPDVLKQIRQHCSTEQVLISDEVAAININITEPGGSYRWHFDRNAVTAILYMNEVDGGETEIIPNSRLHLGRFKHTIVQGWLDHLSLAYLKSRSRSVRRIETKPGRLLLMRGDRCCHSVCEVTGIEQRINVVMTFDRQQQTFKTTQSLNPYLYSAASVDPKTDPNYVKGVRTAMPTMSQSFTGKYIAKLSRLGLLLTSVFVLLSTLAFKANSATTQAECPSPVVSKARPDVDLPWSNYDELCAADFGKPWTDGVPDAGPGWAAKEDAYGEMVQKFLRSRAYRQPVSTGGDGLGWIHDARWRVTGDWAGCPSPGYDQWSNEVHPAVRIYYSPEVMTWLCANRKPGHEVENPPPMPDGAMIIKEMHSAENLAYRPDTGTEEALGKVWVDENYDDAALSWTIMMKGQQSYDGWYWAFFADAPAIQKGCTQPAPTYNPPILTSSALTTAADPVTGYPLMTDECGKPLPADQQVPPPHGPWFPTYWAFSKPDITFPNAEFGNYCIYCHGSAKSQSTFSSLTNIMGEEIEYDYLKQIPPGPVPTQNTDMAPATTEPANVNEHVLRMGSLKAAKAESRAPFPDYNPLNKSAFEKVYTQFSGLTYGDVWPNRFPAETYDHNVSGAEGPDQFLTSDQCLSCHDAGGSGQRLPNMVVVKEDMEQINLTEHAEWSASPMGLGGRDPIFYSMLESELNRADGETDLQKFIPCIQNTCLHCHGNMGQRQHALDTAASHGTPAPSQDLCAKFEPLTDPNLNPPGTAVADLQYWTPEQRAASGYGGKPFLRDYMGAWHGGVDPDNAKYGGLGRDGISCATCHHVADKDLGNSGITFTGNFRVGPANELYGPFDDKIVTEPMQHSLGITPMKGDALSKSAMCGSCHAIYLPVFDNNGTYVRSSFEQTTYLEWANSAFNEENSNVPAEEWRSCQQCHLRDDFVYVGKDGDNHEVKLDKTRIANVQDNTFPKADHAQNIDLQQRDYKRHTMYGLNAFINAYFQQFPLLLGYRQQSYMNGNTVAPLITGREEVLLIARQATADVSISNVSKTSTEISADVTIRNVTGHKLPSGVGFRRAFIEYKILDANGNALWASGLTSSLGIIQDGLSGKDLPSELLQAAPGTSCPDDYQTHYQTITESCQAQIYEELSKDSGGAFTTSFIHRYTGVKDNRLLPKGYRVLAKGDPQPAYCAPWCMEANPDGMAVSDPDYMGNSTQGVAGEDTVTYKVALTAEQLSKAVSISATLYSQATAPSFLNQRFNDASAGARKDDTKRLYFLQSHLNTDAKADDGSAYLDDYKLWIGNATATIN